MIEKTFDHKEAFKKWSKVWDETSLYKCDIESAKKPFYNLWMFPYPSGARMHVGHAYASTGSDIIGRYKRMQGFDVFQPMGFDAFGIHGENYAIKIGQHPLKLMEDLCNRFRDEQFKAIGHGYDWSREIRTYWPSYYKWTQWLFIKLYEAGLAERKEAQVNWCPSCKTVLADEQVIAGECERCHSVVKKKLLKQWFFKITKYSQKLLDNLDKIDWSPKVIEAQRNWIGRSEGALIKFEIFNFKFEIEVFTTRPDTLFGATYIVLSPEHPLVFQITTVGQQEKVQKYTSDSLAKSEIERTLTEKEKTGVFTGAYAISPVNGKQIPIWVADYVLSGYGTGAIMAVPAHDARDFAFARKYNLPIIEAIARINESNKTNVTDEVYEGDGVLVNSGKFDGMTSKEGGEAIVKKLEGLECGKFAVNYKLRDWLISRQRYWSAPIPIIYCKKCGTVPVPEESLPVELPYVEDWKPKGDGRGPLANVYDFVNTVCPKCGGSAERETDTLDNFLDSGWYFFRYPYSQREAVPFDYQEESFKKWFPVHLYIGGAEHSVLHLMYTRFLTMALHDMGIVPFDEPFIKFFAHGHVTKNGKKMSKSLGNIVNPDEYIDKIGADAFRIYLMFMGPYSQGGDFNDRGISGVTRFLERFYRLALRDLKSLKLSKSLKTKNEVEKALAKTISKVTADIEEFRYNTAISAMMTFVNVWEKETLLKERVGDVVKILAPFAPFMAEELWQEYFVDKGGEFKSVHKELWPIVDKNLLVEDIVTIPITVNGKLRGKITVPSDQLDDATAVLKMAKSEEQILKYLLTNIIKKEIYIKGKIINFVI
ncbi:leucine--tRNA ligase [candidate division WWE3 bacterium CG08_land_8_20_14_0_20_40_13]|uniref:Leucine--tRNA ligase n=1 Tax=candidate division WWE3 bacterium CG08_land_8_20_14_0_20_40_13 TaxID=1975084 RepID=A0A2H0XDQ9_UNCKA|nr:MAG: leucine--tRNA ligase [candidate division WWE3 bacterium CG08_land_8_20_14_0_20_40_13]